MVSEKDIIDGCRLGIKEHQTKIYKKFYPVAYNTCMKYAPSREVADDYIQDSFIKLYTNINKFNGNTFSELGAWFKKLVNNYCIDLYRKTKIKLVDEEFNHEKFTYNVDQQLNDYVESEYSILEILKAIQKLSPKYKNIFNLHVMDGYSHEKISKMLDITPDSSKSILYKAKINLRKYLIEEKYGKS